LYQENNTTKTTIEDHRTLQKKEIKRFILIMVVFTIGMAILLINKISAWYIWYIYFAIWTLIEVRIAKNIHLKWYWWALIILAIILIDFLVVELVG
jgi:uncharacterized membrane protein